MRGSFWCDHTLDLALAEAVTISRHPFGNAVAHKGRGCRSGWADAHPTADQTGAQPRYPIARQFGPGVQDHFRVDASRSAFEAQSLLDGKQDLADAEQADHRDQRSEEH